MKRNYFLTTLAAAGMLLLGSAPSFAACPAGTIGTPLAAGQWAIKIQGFVTDTATCGTSCPDPTPVSRACYGVIVSDGACDITGGDVICDKVPAPGITSPSTTAGFPDFSGTPSPANDVGSYFFNSNNTGQIAIVDNTGGQTYAFGIVAELGNVEMRGASLYPGATSDPLVITIEKRNQTITAAQFLNQDAVTFDPAGGGAGGNGLGKGFDAVGVATTEHLDPETNTTPEGGGSIFFNVDGGYDSDIAPGVQLIPSTLICDFHQTLLSQHTGDGTQLTSASLNGDYSCPLAGAAFQTATVLWGSSNQNAFIATVGAAGGPASGLALGTADRAIVPGSPQGQGLIFVTTASNPHPTLTATITNGSTEPLDWTNVTINGGLAGLVSIVGGTCPTVGDLRAWNPVASVPKPTCTFQMQYTGPLCNTTTPTTGTYELVGADHTMITGTPTATGVDFNLKCQ
jgi:hypothetical protein